MSKMSGLSVIVGAAGPKPGMGHGPRSMADMVREAGGESGPGDDHMQAGREATHAFMEALKSDDPEGAWNAFMSMAQICDAMPHEEGEHPDEEGGDEEEDHFDGGMSGTEDSSRGGFREDAYAMGGMPTMEQPSSSMGGIRRDSYAKGGSVAGMCRHGYSKGGTACPTCGAGNAMRT